MRGKTPRLLGLIATTVAVVATSASAVLFTRDNADEVTIVATTPSTSATAPTQPTTTTEPPTTTTTAPPEEPAAPSASPAPTANPQPAAAPTTQAPAPPPPPPPPPAAAPANLAGQIFGLINQSRAANGLGALSWDGQLSGLSNEWSAWMASTLTFVHRDLSAVISSPAYAGWSTLGENLYSGPSNATANDIHNALMASPPHRANVLSPNFTLGAVAVGLSSDGRIWVTENFGAKF